MSEMSNFVLVTGATGMLGTCLVRDLLEEGFKVKAIYRNVKRIDQFEQNLKFYPPISTEKRSNLSWAEADVLDFDSLIQALSGASAVYHAAAMVSFDPADRDYMLETNIKGTANLVNAAIENKIEKFIHVSSIAALGHSEDGYPIDENCHWLPGKKNSGYSISKFHSEMEVWRGIEEGLKAVIVNPSIILGAGDWSTGSPSFFSNIHKGLLFYPKGTTGFVDVCDVARAMILLGSDSCFGKASGNRYLLNAENIKYQHLFREIAQALGVRAPSIATNKIMLAIGWRMAWLASKLTGKKPLISRESVSAANKSSSYSGNRICKDFGFEYTRINTSIRRIANSYMRK